MAASRRRSTAVLTRPARGRLHGTWPNRAQPAFVRSLTAGSAMAGVADGARKTSTTSAGNGIAERVGYDVSPRISGAVGFTGMTRYPRYWRYWPTKKLGRRRLGERPT